MGKLGYIAGACALVGGLGWWWYQPIATIAEKSLIQQRQTGASALEPELREGQGNSGLGTVMTTQPQVNNRPSQNQPSKMGQGGDKFGKSSGVSRSDGTKNSPMGASSAQANQANATTATLTPTANLGSTPIPQVAANDAPAPRFDSKHDPLWWDKAFPKVPDEHVSKDIQELTQLGSNSRERLQAISQFNPNISPVDQIRVKRFLSETLPPTGLTSHRSTNGTQNLTVPAPQGLTNPTEPLAVVTGENQSASGTSGETPARVPAANPALADAEATDSTTEKITAGKVPEPQKQEPAVLTEEARRKLQDSLAENSIKNDLLEVLLKAKPLPEDLGGMMVAIVDDPNQSPVWRDYVVQHYSVFVENIVAQNGLEKSKAEVEPIKTSYLICAEQNKSLAATSLMGMNLLAKKSLVFDVGTINDLAQKLYEKDDLAPGTKATAMSLLLDNGVDVGLAKSREIATNTASSFAERLVAVNHLGQGGKEELEILEKLLGDAKNRNLNAAILASIERLKGEEVK